MTTLTVMLADSGMLLLSPWKPILIWATFVAWAWLVGTKIDPDARHLRLEPTRWNILNLCFAFIGLGVMLFAGIFYIAWPAGMLVMLAPILVYWRVRNKEVPEDRRYRLFAGNRGDAGPGKKRRSRRKQTLELVFAGPSGEFEIPESDDPRFDSCANLETLIKAALQPGGSRLDLALGGGGLAAAVTVHTVRSKLDPMSPEDGAHMVNLIKEISGLDLQETRKTQVGQMQVTAPGSRHTLTVTATGTSKGQFIRIDVDEAERIIMPIDALGFIPDQRAVLQALVSPENRHGIVLLTSPQGQGLTTTGLSILGQHDAYTSNIKVVERRTIKAIEGIDHVVWDPSNPDLDYATTLQSILRRDPDIVLAEAVDSETAQVAARAGREGAMQYLAFNGESVAGAIRDWCRLVGDVELATKPLRAVVSQRLVRVLCPDCKQSFTPAEPKKFGLPEGTTLHRASGEVQVRNRVEPCATCAGSGYTGVTAIYEVLEVDDEIRRILATGDLKAAMLQARRNRMLLLQEVGLQRAVAGITTIEEVTRVLGGGQKPKTKAKAAN